MRTVFIPPPETDGEVNYWGCAVRFRNGEASIVGEVAAENCTDEEKAGKRHAPGRLVDAFSESTDPDGKVTKSRSGWWLQIGEV